ncbi:glycosyltransferase family 4 protein [Paucibacter sp. Y2R2-4]|uniref:glycosyltransferase family 4 protein n=1 Tax=Paucibacter sp. Y2R2-4 TaxID=2893553 RepID=UPI0021E46DE9|nr:glycosyltransferase family 4 protein [Paucibacter sp. Y2R2-4]MCV2348585.1 glycosyltransferase family 4 protein [Paucibacter sp. Y2R2-4]
MSAEFLSICMLSDDFLPGATGVGSHLQVVCRRLVELGHQVSIITSRRPAEPEYEEWLGVKVYRVRTIKAFGFYQAIPSVKTLEYLLGVIKPNLVHFHYLGLMLLRAMPLCVKRSLPVVYTYHMTEDHLTQPLPMRPFRRLIVSKIVAICNSADLVISVSENLAATLPGKGIRAPVRFISNPVDFVAPESVEAQQSEAGFAVMFAGRLNPEKNIPFLLRSFAQLRQRVPEAQLWIAGAGADKESLMRQCDALVLGQSVRFLGFLGHGELARFYKACDVFVLPSWVETQGLVAMEAMWFGKPVIVADSVVSATELVEHGVNGYVVRADQDQELAESLIAMHLDPGMRLKMGAAGQLRSQRFEAGRVMVNLVNAYRQTVQDVSGRKLT